MSTALFFVRRAVRRGGSAVGLLATVQQALCMRKENRRDVRVLALLAQCMFETHDLAGCESCLSRAIQCDPGDPRLCLLLGGLFRAQRRYPEAIRWLTRAASLAPDAGAVLFELGDAFLSEHLVADACACARRVVELDPAFVPGRSLLVRALLAANETAQAVEAANEAIELDPNNGLLFADLGVVLFAEGRLEDARVASRRAIELAPNLGLAYSTLASAGRVTDRELVEQMLRVAETSDVIRPDLMEYALAKSLEDLGEYEESMKRYDQANALAYGFKFGGALYDDRVTARQHEAQRDLFELLAKLPGGGRCESELPILVVGMPRSGTTLVHQILTSHSQVGGAGELSFWPIHAAIALDARSGLSTEAGLDELAARYLATLEEAASGYARVVDKMPTNYLHLGLIQRALPKCRIVHVRRIPMDTCFSIYATQNGVRIPWAHDKAHIASCYSAYEDQMTFWRSRLDMSRVFEVQYEELVSSPEAVTRAMIEFCGLEWEEGCLTPERNECSVMTPSRWQVRQKIYRSSVGRWLPFEPWLQEFKALDRPDRERLSA